MNPLLDILDKVGYALDTPGALLRGALSGAPGERRTGREMLTSWGLTEPNDPNAWEGADFAGFAADVIADPLNLIPAGALAKILGKSGKLDDLARGAKALAADEVGSVVVPTFYSRSRRAAENLPPNIKAQSLKNTLERLGAHPQELADAQINLLTTNPGEKLSRDAVMEFLESNAPRIDVRKGSGHWRDKTSPGLAPNYQEDLLTAPGLHAPQYLEAGTNLARNPQGIDERAAWEVWREMMAPEHGHYAGTLGPRGAGIADNLIAAVRRHDRPGNTLLVGEIQSDLHQDARTFADQIISDLKMIEENPSQLRKRDFPYLEQFPEIVPEAGKPIYRSPGHAEAAMSLSRKVTYLAEELKKAAQRKNEFLENARPGMLDEASKVYDRLGKEAVEHKYDYNSLFDDRTKQELIEQMVQDYPSDFLSPGLAKELKRYRGVTSIYAERHGKAKDLFSDAMQTLRDVPPAAPFVSNWQDVALKQQIREAAEKGYENITLESGLGAFLNSTDYSQERLIEILRKLQEGGIDPLKVTSQELQDRGMWDAKMLSGMLKNYRGTLPNKMTKIIKEATGEKIPARLIHPEDLGMYRRAFLQNHPFSRMASFPITDKLRDAALHKGFSTYAIPPLAAILLAAQQDGA